MITLFNYLLLSNIFTGAVTFFTQPFEFYLGYIFMALFLCFYVLRYRTFHLSAKFIGILFFFLILSYLNVLWGDVTPFPLLKQIFGFVFNGVVYYLLFRINKNNTDKLFRVYLNLAFIIALVGIIQEISYIAHFKYGYDYSYFLHKFKHGGNALGLIRVSAILPEPAHFGATVMPAAFVAVLNIFNKNNEFIGRKRSFLILVSLLLSFSLVSYIGLIMAFVLIMLNYKKVKFIVMGTVITVIFAAAVYNYVPMIRMRIDDTFAVVTGKIIPEKANLSTFAMGSNALVAYKSFSHNPVFGSGLGSHPLSYDKYISEVINPNVYNMPLCKGDAGSLFLRLVSETGLLGVLLFFYFVYRFYVSRARDKYLWIISNSIVCLFLINLIRMGNYFSGGFIFFIWLYYFAGREAGAKRIAGNAGTVLPQVSKNADSHC